MFKNVIVTLNKKIKVGLLLMLAKNLERLQLRLRRK